MLYVSHLFEINSETAAALVLPQKIRTGIKDIRKVKNMNKIDKLAGKVKSMINKKIVK